VALLTLVMAVVPAAAEPPTAAEGPFPRLVLRGAMLIDGTGAPPRGPVDVVIEGERIVQVVALGQPGAAVDPARRPALGEGGREIDLAGAWLLPGFVDLYAYPGRHPEYAMKLWLAHGVTTAREPICETGMEACRALAAASQAHEIAAPRIVPWLHFGLGRPGLAIADADDARRWVAEAVAQGAAGIKFRGERGEVFTTALDEAERRGLPTSAHLAPLWPEPGLAAAARHGLDLVEHWYGLPEALLPGRALPAYPPGYNWADEQQRFAFAARLWRQAAAPGSAEWNAALDEVVAAGAAMVPTLALYEANRDLMRARRAEWHDDYALPALWSSFTPHRSRHAAHFFAWTSEDEAAWTDAFATWSRFLADYHRRGGRVLVGTDTGFMYHLHGFGYVRELELLRQAGLSPLEVLRAATLDGARALGWGDRVGSVEAGKLADLVVVEADPLADLKVLYGTGALRFDDQGRESRVGGVRWTIKGGVVYDAKALLAEVAAEVAAAKAEAEAEGDGHE
jgi:hypothetical protein